MDDLDKLRWIKEFEKDKKQPHLVHTIHPPAGWTNDSECYYLIMDLPDFKKDQVEVIVDPLGTLIIKGARKSGENEHVKFERHFKLPEDSDMTKTVSRKLQNDMLYVTVWKQLAKAPDKFEFESGSHKEEVHETRGEEESKKTKPDEFESASSKEKGHETRGGDEKDAKLDEFESVSSKKKEHETRGEDEKEEVKPNEFESASSKEKKHETRGEEEKKEAKPKTKEENVDDEKKEYNVPKGILKKLADEQKCIWFGILAFAFGVYVASHRLQNSSSK